MKIRVLLPLLIACSAAACGSQPFAAEPRFVTSPTCSNPAPLHGQPDSGAPDTYIVVFKDGVDAAETARTLATRYGFQTRYLYEQALLGFSAVLGQGVVASLRCEPSVKFVEHDRVISIGG